MFFVRLGFRALSLSLSLLSSFLVFPAFLYPLGVRRWGKEIDLKSEGGSGIVL